MKKTKKKKQETTLALDSLSATMAPTIDLEEEEEEKEVKKKKRKKKVFYDMKTKKGRITRQSGGKQFTKNFIISQNIQNQTSMLEKSIITIPKTEKLNLVAA